MSNNEDIKVTIVIPNYNGIKYLKGCLESIEKQTVQSKVIIVDNGSTDESISYIKEGFRSYRLIELGENTGFANAVNVGIKEADTEYVFLLNNDTVLHEKATEKLLSAIESNKRIFSVSSKMLQMHGNHRIDDAGDLYCALGWAFSPARDKSNKMYNKRCNVTTACAGAALYRKSVFEKIGYFDETHFCYLEDVDIGYRARIHGYKNIYHPDAIVFHAGSGTSGSRYNDFKERLTVANNIYFIYKNFPLLQLIINLPLLILGVLIKLIFFARKGLAGSYMKGLADGFTKCSENVDHKVQFRAVNLFNYVVLQFELWINCIRRLVG